MFDNPIISIDGLYNVFETSILRTNHDTPDFCEQIHIFGNLQSLQFVTQQIPRQHWQLFWCTFCWFHKLHLLT